MSPSSSSQYWWETTGRDISHMLHAAQYPETIQRDFLSYYKESLCPLLGDAPNPATNSHAESWTWDGSTHEYSFEFKGSTNMPDVRFVADFSSLRPIDKGNPLSLSVTEAVISSFASRAPGFDNTWFRALKDYMDCSQLPVHTQKDLIAKAGHMTPLLIGFDISRQEDLAIGMLPIMGKAYFIPCLKAEATKKTRFEVCCGAIRAIPGIPSYPNILKSLELLDDYLQTKPKDWRNGARFLSTDFVSPERSRLKIYFRCPGASFEDIWDYFTLGGRIAGMEDVKDQYQQFVNLLGGNKATSQESDNEPTTGIETANRRKLTTIYFSLDEKSPYPAPKVAFCVRNFVENDALVAQGLDKWLENFGWSKGGMSIQELVSSSLTQRKLEEKAGIFTFIGLARKHADKGDLTIQTYLSPELYATPRFNN